MKIKTSPVLLRIATIIAGRRVYEKVMFCLSSEKLTIVFI